MMAAGIIAFSKKHKKPCQELFYFFTKNHFPLISSPRNDPEGRIVVNGYKITRISSAVDQIFKLLKMQHRKEILLFKTRVIILLQSFNRLAR